MNEQTRCNTLHDALDTYEEMLTHETDAGVTSMATLHSRQLMVRRLKKYHEDMPISEITLDVCVAMIGYWRDRPASATTGKPIAASTAQRTLSELIRFFGWLDASDQFEWTAPSHFGQISRRVRTLVTDRRGIQREMFTPEHLAILYQHATPTQRLMLCLAMNCGLRAVLTAVQNGGAGGVLRRLKLAARYGAAL